MNKFLGIILASIFSFIVIVQAGNTAKAQAFYPITGPITNPITSPITSALVITGKVTYQQFGFFFFHVLRNIPAVGVTVTASDFFKHTIVSTTKTDTNGNYVLPISHGGLYQVKPTDPSHTFFVPPFHIVSIKNKSKTADFKGVKF